MSRELPEEHWSWYAWFWALTFALAISAKSCVDGAKRTPCDQLNDKHLVETCKAQKILKP